MKDYLKSLFSVDEKKVSTVVLILIIFSLLGAYLTFKNGDLPNNLTNFLMFNIATVLGVNIPQLVMESKIISTQSSTTNSSEEDK